MKKDKLLEVVDLKKYFDLGGGFFSSKKGTVKAVDGLNFSIYAGETLGIVGESGCGKSTTGRLLLRLLEPTAGKIYFKERELTSVDKKELKEMRRNFQMVFQDPYGSLDPRMKIKSIIAEPLNTHNLYQKNRDQRIDELLEAVSIPASYKNRYPHEFSGGQRQRIGIARALAVNPDFIVADEPVASLDVSIQAQILNLMNDLQEKYGLTYFFIAHDLSVVQYISDRIGVMYLGQIVELAESDEVYYHPIHPYTRALLSAIPVPDPDVEHQEIPLQGEVGSPVNPPTGCRFHTRCPFAEEICSQKKPEFKEVKKDHYVACHIKNEPVT
ncbi:MAG: ABC transporter ATP-binding protein [Halanaerobiales bacterium]